ncbi:MAG: hypothetical protein V1742_06525 [Pseudomonadota bacterium]
MGLTADREIVYREGLDIEYPMAAVKIYAGAMVCANADGYAAPAANTVNFKFVGVALEWKDNSLGSPGAKKIKVRRDGIFQFDASSILQASVGADMYVVDDHTFDESDPGQGIKCGKLVAVDSGTLGWIAIGRRLATAYAGAADALTLSDAGDHFAAAVATVAQQVQDLAKGPFFLTIPRFTGWTKDGTDKDIVTLPLMEFPFPVRIKRAYASVLTAPGTGKTLVLGINGSPVATIAEAAVVGEDEALDIAIAKDANVVPTANETAAGAGANADLVLVYYKDDGE